MTAVIIETEASIQEGESSEDPLADFEEEEPAQTGDTPDKRYFSEKENREVVETINRIVEKHARSDFRLSLAGGPVIVYAFNRATMKDVERCIVLTLFAVALFLGLLFRRLSGILLPITDILKETHQALNENDPAAYHVPQDRDVIAQELFLFENSGADDLERIVSSQFSKTRITIKTPWISTA